MGQSLKALVILTVVTVYPLLKFVKILTQIFLMGKFNALILQKNFLNLTSYLPVEDPRVAL